MKKLFKVVSCRDLDRCVSYSTLERAEEAVYKLAAKHGYKIIEKEDSYPEDYDWYDGYHSVKTWHHYTTEEGYSYTIVELN